MSGRPDLTWRRSAACLGHDVSLFFPGGDPVVTLPPAGSAAGPVELAIDLTTLAAERSEPAEGAVGGSAAVDEQEEADRIERAKAVCATCPVQTRCLQHALEYREHHGIWGGTTEAERRRIIRRRRRRATGAG
jgi:hypothetical protein